PNDKSSQRLLRQALCTCGTKDSVVSVPAANPNNVIQRVICNYRFSRSSHFSKCAGGVHSSNLSSMVSGFCATSTSCAFSLRTNPSSTARSKTASNPSQYFSTFSRQHGFC